MTDKTASAGASQLLVDLGPIALFVVAYNVLQRVPSTKENAVFIATGVFIVATLAAIAYCLVKRGSVPPVLIVTGVLVTIFGGLTIALHDENFIKLKVTVVNAFFAAAIFGSLAIGQNVWRLMFAHAFNLPERIWRIFAIRWGCYYIFMAALNEVLRHSVSTETWVNLRFIPFALTFIFAAANMPLLLKHTPEDSDSGPALGQQPPS